MECGLSPGDAFFRNRRPSFVNDVIEAGRQGYVSSDNAAKMVAAHVGDNRNEQWDAVLMTVRWPHLAKSLHSRFGLYGEVPQISRVDPNLRADAECRYDFHALQTVKEIYTIRSRVDIANLKTSLSHENFLILMLKDNKNPRSLNSLPSFIAFCAPGRRYFGFFPHDSEGILRQELFAFLSQKILAVRKPDVVRKWFGLSKKKFRHVHLGKLSMELGTGRSDDAIAHDEHKH